MRYTPNWLSLSEARELLIASGLLASEAETDLTRALRETKIHFKRAIKGVTFRGHAVQPEVFRQMTVRDGNRFRLRVPADLAPNDLDWDNSRPGRPWPLGEGYLAHIARLELSRSDLEREFRLVEAEASEDVRREDASSAGDSGRDRPRRKWARKAIDGAYPNGDPGPKKVPNGKFVEAVQAYAKLQRWNIGGPDTILREAGRRSK